MPNLVYRIASWMIGMLCCSTAFTQAFYLRQITPEDGLPSSIVYDFDQDSRGVLWMGTENGLCAFDGTTFTNYTVKHGLPNNVVHRLLVDGKDRKWLTTLAAQPAVFVDGKAHIPTWADSMKFTNYYLAYSKLDSLLWFGGFEEYKDGRKRYVSYTWSEDTLNDISDFNISSLARPSEVNGENLLASARNIFHFRRDSFMYITAVNTDQNLYQCRVFRDGLLCFKGANFHYSQKWSMVYIDPYQGIVKQRFPELDTFLINRKAVSFTVDRSDNIWISSRDGLLFVGEDPYGQLETKYLLPGIHTNNIYQDHEDNIWIGTEGEGCFLAISTNIQTLSNDNHQEIKQIRSLATDEAGNIYVGHLDGTIKKYNADFQLVYDRKIANERVVDIVADATGIWVATNQAATHLDHDGSNQITHKMPGPVKCLLPEQDRLNIFSYRVSQLANNTVTINTVHSSRIYTAFQNPDQSILLGSSTGLFRLGERRDTLILLHPQIVSDVRGIELGPDGLHWIATLGEGLYLMNGSEIVANITTEDGLSSDICNSLLLDERHAWVGTNKGINKIDLQTMAIEIIGTEDGLSGSEITYLAKSGSVILAANEAGIDLIPDRFTKRVQPPILHLNTLVLGGDTLAFDDQQHYQIPFQQNDIQITYTGISFKSLGDITYAYQLEGLNPDWITSTSNFANWSAVPPGEYLLKIKAKGKGQHWSDTLQIPIEVKAPWWQKWWFTVLVVLGIILVISLIFLAIINNLRRKNALQEELQELQLTALRAQMNPHFMFNALNSIQEFINTNDSRSANMYLSRFASLVRSILNNSTKAKVLLTEELKQLNLYLELENLRFNNEITYQIFVDPKIDPEHVLIPTMIVQPFAENAIVHGLFHKQGEKRLSINFSLAPGDNLICEIKDNGIGRKQSEKIKSQRNYQGRSLGIRVTQDRLKLLNSGTTEDILLTYSDGYQEGAYTSTGTTVTLVIPYTVI